MAKWIDPTDWTGLLAALTDNKSDVLSCCRVNPNANERELADRYYALLGATRKGFRVPGLFGWGYHEADEMLTVRGCQFISECKKCDSGSEYGYWHAVIQASIYRFRDNRYPVVCTVFDRGRKAHQRLAPDDQRFLSQWRQQCIFTLRICPNQGSDGFIEHNLNGEWEEIR